MFSKYVWELYLKAGGKEVADFFAKCLQDDFGKKSEEYVRKVCEFHRKYCPDSSLTEWIAFDLMDLASPDIDFISDRKSFAINNNIGSMKKLVG